MSAGEASREAAFTKSQRCPYCHESIAVDEDAWVACEQCLGRHHRACWDESGSCGSCSHTQGLPNQQAISAPLSLTPLTEEVSSPGQDLGAAEGATAQADHRRETARLFEEDDERARLLASIPMTPLTLGLWPVVQAERRLQAHRQTNKALLDEEHVPEDLPADLREQLEEARRRAGPSSGGIGMLLRRFAAPAVSVVGWALLIPGLIALLVHSTGSYDYLLASVAAMVGSAVASLGMLSYLHAFREAVRSHERDQLFVKLVARGVPSAASKDLLQRLSRRWGTERLGHTMGSLFVAGVLGVALTHGGAIPLLTILLPVLVATLLTPCVFGALRLHAKHEQEADEVTDLYGQGEDAKPTES